MVVIPEWNPHWLCRGSNCYLPIRKKNWTVVLLPCSTSCSGLPLSTVKYKHRQLLLPVFNCHPCPSFWAMWSTSQVCTPRVNCEMTYCHVLSVCCMVPHLGSMKETVQKYGRQGSKWKLWRYSECLKKGCFVDTTVGDGKTSGHNSEQ